MGRVIHFELFGDDAKALADFYRTVLGWEISSWEGPFEYYLVGTGPNTEPGIDGAIAPFGAAGDQRTVVTADIDDIEAATARVLAAGGTAVTDKSAVPGIGWQRYYRDPSGLVFSLMQNDPSAGIPVGMAGAGAGATAQAPEADVWADLGDRLREFGTTIGAAVTEAAGSPQAQRLREQADRAGEAIGEASRQAADRARPHVISALDRVSVELGELAARLRREPEEPVTTRPPAPGVTGEPGEGPGPEGGDSGGSPVT